MKITHVVALASAFTVAMPLPAVGQTVSQVKVSNSTKVKDGVATTRHVVTHTTRRRTHRPRKVLGVTVGHKVITHKTVRTTSTSSNGDSSTSVKTSN